MSATSVASPRTSLRRRGLVSSIIARVIFGSENLQWTRLQSLIVSVCVRVCMCANTVQEKQEARRFRKQQISIRFSFPSHGNGLIIRFFFYIFPYCRYPGVILVFGCVCGKSVRNLVLLVKFGVHWDHLFVCAGQPHEPASGERVQSEPKISSSVVVKLDSANSCQPSWTRPRRQIVPQARPSRLGKCVFR